MENSIVLAGYAVSVSLLKREIYMKYNEKKILLKNGTCCIFKNLRGKHAEDMIKFLKQTLEESSYILQYPEEINFSVEEEAIYLEEERNDKDRILIAAFIENELVGTVEVTAVANCFKLRHRGELGIVVKKEFWNLGIGKNLLLEAIAYAKGSDYEQLELEVAEENEHAIKLYEKCGFVCYGLRDHSLRYKDGTYSNERLMIKKL
ncbi:GNAT family N-acetyltransferase [Lachnospiraceae bacterium WCA-693-APC-MOT-I]|uniref:GNAT family N-acetyltransferase n=2 Tax=Velocimicrobium porci TaxID=2606634 RepID=A0A6L5Y0Q8_9FIRM|nr:GNAT family N-acetyltransferase [Velocimicrobium porci]